MSNILESYLKKIKGIISDPRDGLPEELFAKNRDVRGHFITFLYKCNPVNEPDIKKKCTGEKPKPGQWRWHDKCPKNLISQHLAYKKFINGHD